MVAVGRDPLVAFVRRRLEADDDGLLPDVKVTESPDQAHAIKLSRLLLEPPDQQHLAVVTQQFVCRYVGSVGRSGGCGVDRLGGGFAGGHRRLLDLGKMV